MGPSPGFVQEPRATNSGFEYGRRCTYSRRRIYQRCKQLYSFLIGGNNRLELFKEAAASHRKVSESCYLLLPLTNTTQMAVRRGMDEED